MHHDEIFAIPLSAAVKAVYSPYLNLLEVLFADVRGIDYPILYYQFLVMLPLQYATHL